MKRLAAPLAGFIVLAVSAGAALAGSHEAKVQAYLDSHVRAWLSSPQIIEGIDQ